MNGRQALRMLLLEDWNSQKGKNFTPKDLKRVMTSLNLKQGVMTANQVRHCTFYNLLRYVVMLANASWNAHGTIHFHRALCPNAWCAESIAVSSSLSHVHACRRRSLLSSLTSSQ